MHLHVIGTAGHIDHGKSTLVHALTGIDPDRLAEEKRRGMTIELGFAWLRLPSGREASVVDVPGHERFIRHMLAGAGGVDVALLVVAADEGVMPQTREHLDILDLLGVSCGVVALTKRDLVDDEWLELVREDVRATLAGTSLEGAQLVACSATTGAGLDELCAALDAALDTAWPHPDRGRPHLPVDRVFTLAGFGTVVTGTLLEGTLQVGQDVEIAPRGLRARIRGLQAHKSKLDRAAPGGRVAVNLAGVAVEEVSRGDVVTLPGAIPPAVRLDVRLRAVGALAAPLTHNMPVTVHTGAAEVAGRLGLLDRPELDAGEEGWVQLRLAGPVAAARGDRVVVRRPTPSATLAGGVIVDAQPARHRRFSPRVLRHLEVLAAGAPEDRVLDALGAGSFQSTSEIASRADLAPDDAQRTLEALAAAGRVHRAGTLWCGTSYWNDLVARAREALAAHHARYPLRRGLPAEELRVRLRLSPEAWSAAAHALDEEGAVRLLGEVVALSEHEPRFTPTQERAADLVRQTLAAHPYAPPALADLPGVDAALLEALVERGEVVAIADGVHLGRTAYEEMVAAALEAIDAQGSVTVAALRDRFGTSRKYALALLEHLDDERITRRVGDARVRGSRAPRDRR
jgi:selenocysteine-specific elongation factor